MKQKIDKVNGIRAALLKRGEAELIDPYKLMAFSDACLDDCITKMKYATPKYPYRYFLKCAFDYCKWNNQEPDFVTADALREKRLPEFENEPVRPAGIAQQVYEKKSPKEVAKSNDQIIQETKERQKKEQLASATRFPKVPLEKQYEEDLKSLDVLREQIKEHKPGTFLYSITAELIRGFEEKFARFGKETVNTPPDLGSAPDLNNPGIRAIVQAQADRLREVPWDSEDGLRIRDFLNGIGVKI